MRGTLLPSLLLLGSASFLVAFSPALNADETPDATASATSNATAAAAIPDTAISLNRVDRYSYEVKHEVRWRSLDDELTYETQQLWTLSLSRRPGALTAKVLSIRAIHQGPDRTYQITVPADPNASPNTALTQQREGLLAPLAAWVDVPITLQLDEDGRISSLDGSKLREAWLDSLPAGAQVPDAPQLTDAALVKWWQEVLLRPPVGDDSQAELVPLTCAAARQRQPRLERHFLYPQPAVRSTNADGRSSSTPNAGDADAF